MGKVPAVSLLARILAIRGEKAVKLPGRVVEGNSWRGTCVCKIMVLSWATNVFRRVGASSSVMSMATSDVASNKACICFSSMFCAGVAASVRGVVVPEVLGQSNWGRGRAKQSEYGLIVERQGLMVTAATVVSKMKKARSLGLLVGSSSTVLAVVPLRWRKRTPERLSQRNKAAWTAAITVAVSEWAMLWFTSKWLARAVVRSEALSDGRNEQSCLNRKSKAMALSGMSA